MALVTTFDAANSRVTLVGTSIPVIAGMPVYVQRNSGAGWVGVRNGDPVFASGGGFTIYDYEFVPNTLNLYRVITDFFYDDFNRNSVDSWGVAASGQAWTLSGAVAANWDVSTSTDIGTYVMAEAVNVSSAQASAAATQDFDWYGSVEISQTATGGALYAGMRARSNTAADTVLSFQWLTTGSVSLDLRGNNNTTVLDTAVIPSASPNVRLFFRFQGQGRDLRAKVWTGTQESEPSNWTLEATDTVNAASGTFQVEAIRLTGNTNVNPLLTFRAMHAADLNSTSPQLKDLGTDSETPIQSGVWLKFPLRPFLNREIELCNWGSENRASRGQVFQVLGRRLPVAVNEVRASREFGVIVKAVDFDEADAIELALSFGDTVYLQTPGTNVNECGLARRNYPDSGYFFVGNLESTRVLDGVATKALTFDLTEVDGPDSAVEYSTVTWAGIVANFATWADVLATFPTWLDVQQYVSDPEDEIVG